jgi:NAD(P)-dependent dehydrogenase (short-subunit alcohol dehydrogenase family)
MTRTVLITGGTRGIGYGIAEALARDGYNLALNGVRDEPEVTNTLDTLRRYNVDVLYCPGRIDNASDRRRVIDKAFSHFQSIDALVNNAGVAPSIRNDLLELTEEGYDEVMNVNLKGTFFFAQEVAKRFSAQKKKDPTSPCSIVTITSVSAEVVSLNRAAYCLSKSGLSMMTKLLAARMSEWNIPVYEVRPGIINTDMTSGVKEKYDKLIAGGLTLEKRWGTPGDIGKIVAALLRGDLPYSTGQVIHADGGMGIRIL